MSASGRTLPALSESSWLRYLAFALLYAAQGLPRGLMLIALPAWLAEQGAAPGQIGAFVGTVFLPWSLKIVNGPLMDRFTYLPMGRRRPWVLAAQAGIVASLVGMSLAPDPLQSMTWLTVAGFCMNAFAAFQDVAVDGMAIDVVPHDEQGRANGFMMGGQTLGAAGAAAGSAACLNLWGLAVTSQVLAGVMVGLWLVPLLLRERPGERLLPWSAGAASPESATHRGATFWSIARDTLAVFVLPMSLVTIAVVFAFNMSAGLLQTMLPVLAVSEVGWDDTRFSNMMANVNFVAGVGSMVVGGLLVERVGRVRLLGLSLLAFVCVAGAAGALPSVWRMDVGLIGLIGGYAVVRTLVSISFFATAMALCQRSVAATQYALYMALSNLGFSAGAGLYGAVHARVGHDGALWVVALWIVVPALAAWWIDLSAHRARLGGRAA